jgi:hypothetical protein
MTFFLALYIAFVGTFNDTATVEQCAAIEEFAEANALAFYEDCSVGEALDN